MANIDPIADMLTRIRNAILVSKEDVSFSFSNIRLSIIHIFKNEGFIKDFEILNQNNKKNIKILLHYNKIGKSPINKLERISTSSRRIYSGYKKMGQILNGYGILVVSTSHGVMTEKQAKFNKLGGELLCSIY